MGWDWEEERWRRSADKHVLMVSKHCCSRVQKQAQALKAKGWRVDSISSARPPILQHFDYCKVTLDNFTEGIRNSGASIIHVHNEPDELMRYAVDGAKGRPVVYDCHDLEYHRKGYVTDNEAFAFSHADAIVNVGEAYRDFAYSLHPWSVPETVVYSLPFRAQVPDPPAEREWAICYEGGVVPPGGMGWRDLSVPCEVFQKAGITFDIYPMGDVADCYPNVKRSLGYEQLLTTIAGYEFSFVGIDPAHEKYLMAYPNKLWESAACGCIPVIVNAPAAAEAFGSGIVAKSAKEAVRKMRACDTKAMREDVLAHVRFMDDEIDKTIALYQRFRGAKAA